MRHNNVTYKVMAVIKPNKYQIETVNELKFFKATFKGEEYSYLVWENITKHLSEEPVGCPICMTTAITKFIMIGNDQIKGLYNCQNCGSVMVLDFDNETNNFLKGMLKISDELLCQNWHESRKAISH